MTPRSAVALVVLAAGCKGMTITGTVTDPAGNPIPEARVAVVGHLCFTTTDEAGRFELSCERGEYDVAIGKQGYISNDVEVAAIERKQYDIGNRTLIAIPEGTGLFLFDGAGYADMEEGYVRRITEGPKRRYCLVEDSPVNTVPAGRVSFFDKDAQDWLLFRLDEQGCARHLEVGDTGWRIAKSDTPDARVVDVGPQQSVHLFDLEPGAHFLAWWNAGTFLQDKVASEEQEDRRYSGYLIEVE